MPRSRIIGIGVAIVTTGVLLALAITRPWEGRSSRSSPSPPDIVDPRLAYDGPFKNVHPNVQYVGDERCAECHREIAKKYARHPMGRSMGMSVDDRMPAGTFEKWGSHFVVVKRDGKVFHREERRDPSGKPVAFTEYEAPYAMGSATRGKSYLVERGGRLFMSPISWYSEKNLLDISPGYTETLRFNRPIVAGCVFCHVNHANAVSGPINTYENPPFRGLSIGCERCHGPGEMHARLHEDNEKYTLPDHTIVNCRHLSPGLRDSICEQCHLQGEQRVKARGTEPFDFRPGMHLSAFMSVFVRRSELLESYHSVGQVEQMRLSKCYTASGAKLGCISCHDPHERPSPENRVEFYRNRCLACHEQQGCRLDAAERKRQEPADSCIACHMGKAGSANIPHTAVTDHRVLRRPLALVKKPIASLNQEVPPIEDFYREQAVRPEPERDRDLSIALANLYETAGPSASILARMALPGLERAVEAHPGDAHAWDALGRTRAVRYDVFAALVAWDKALAADPNLEEAAFRAALEAPKASRNEAAIAYIQRAIKINPHVFAYHQHLAKLSLERRDWTLALESCERMVALEPVNDEARAMLVTCLVRMGQNARAKKEFDILIGLRPKNEAEMREWFNRIIR